MKIPFTPVIYEHAARFVGRSPWEVSRDPELMFAAHRAAYLEYRQQVIAVAIDIYNLEAEAYGAKVAASTRRRHPGDPASRCLPRSRKGSDSRRSIPQRDGRIAMMLSVAQRLKREFPDADVRLPVGGPFSIAFNLRGINDLCLDAALCPEELAKMLMRLAENQAVLCRAVAKAGLDVAFFESAAAPPILSPRQFHELEMPALRRVLEIAAEAVGHPVPCIMGGNTYPGAGRHPLDRHELPRLQRGDRPGRLCRAGLPHPSPGEDPRQSRSGRGGLPRSPADLSRHRPRAGDRRPPHQLRDGHRAPCRWRPRPKISASFVNTLPVSPCIQPRIRRQTAGPGL